MTYKVCFDNLQFKKEKFHTVLADEDSDFQIITIFQHPLQSAESGYNDLKPFDIF
jgi:hypothetical protein